MVSNRYRWVKPLGVTDRIELVDNITAHRVATITFLNRMWTWRRETTLLLNGTPPAHGTTKGLMQAKVRVLDGLTE